MRTMVIEFQGIALLNYENKNVPQLCINSKKAHILLLVISQTG